MKSYITYTVKVFKDGTKHWYLGNKRHREDGPAMDFADGSKLWFLDDVMMTEARHKAKMKPVKEMTMAELEEALGYSVKVVK